MSIIKNIAKNDYFANIFNKFYTVAIGLLSTMFLTRYLGLALKGEYGYVQQVTNIAVLILDLGVNQSYSFFYKKNKGGVYGKYLNFYVLQGLLYTIIAAVLVFVWRGVDSIVYVFMLVPFTVIHKQFEATMAVENIRLKIRMHMLNATTKFVLYALIFFSKNVIGYSILYPVLVSIFIDLVTIIVYFLNHREKITLFDNDWGFFWSVLKFSWIPMLTALLITLNYSVDIIFLKHMGTKEQTSLYSTAAGIINYVWMIPDAFKEVLVSRVAKSSDLSHVNRALKFSVASVLVIIGMFAVVGRLAIWILYGEDFLASYGVTLILMIGCLSMTLYKILGVLMLAEGKRLFYFITLLVSVTVNIVINALVIPVYGMYGAAWASVASYTVCGITFYVYYLKIKKQRFVDTIVIRKSDIQLLLRGLKK